MIRCFRDVPPARTARQGERSSGTEGQGRKMARGEGNWMVVRRCLAIVRRVLRGPATWGELVQAVRDELGVDAYDARERSHLRRLFDDDLARLRAKLGIDLRSDRRTHRYTLRSAGPGLVDLPEASLSALMTLLDTFSDVTPGAVAAREALETLLACLPAERMQRPKWRGVPLAVEAPDLDDQSALRAITPILERAIRERRLMRFTYRSPGHDPTQPRRHLVAPLELTIRDGHLYLRARSQQVEGPAGAFYGRGELTFRVQYIQQDTIELLPQRFAEGGRRRRVYWLEYELYGPLARGAISEHFAQMEVVRDEAAEVVRVRGMTDDLFQAVQTLLRYGRNCKVLAPPEAVRAMREHVEGMARRYGIV